MPPSTNPPGFIRSYDPIKDAEEVIRLIEKSFNLQNDPESRNVINQMRLNSQRLREGGWLFNPGTINPGFVWVIDNRIVGNINILFFFENLKQIALIANVAVQPEYQKMGIATSLTKHALRFIKHKRVAEIWLQVSGENQAARKMYSDLGFQFIRRINCWSKEGQFTRRVQTPLPDRQSFSWGPRRISDWSFQKGCLEGLYPKDTRWYSSLKFNLFSPFSILNPLNWDDLDALQHFALRKEKKLIGILSLQKQLSRSDNLWFALRQDENEEEYLNTLLTIFLEREWSGRPLRVEYPDKHCEKVFKSLAFHLVRRLDWMKYK